MIRTLQQKLEDARKHLEPVRRSLTWVFSTPPGREVLDVLERTFIEPNVPKDQTGAVDANAVLIAFGQRQVIDFIRKFVESTEGQGDT